MRPGREMDTAIAQDIFGHRVWAKNKILFENPPQGDRPLRNYSKEIQWAWEIVEKMDMTLIRIEGEKWFAFVGPKDKKGWESPQALLKCLDAGEFDDCGASVGDKAAVVICEAALNAVKKRTATPLELVKDAPPSEESAELH